MTTPNTYQHLQGKDFLNLTDLTPSDLSLLLELAHDLKKKQKSGELYTPLKGKTLAMIFDKPSTRTRISFEVGIIQLGGAALHLQRDDLQLGRGESVEDTAHVLSRYVDGILIRTFHHELVESLAQAATIPVINGLTDLVHPCQILADFLTIQEKKGDLAGLKLAYLGDGNNVVHSLMHGAAMTGMELTICTPQGYEPLAQIWEEIGELAEQTGAEIQLVHDPYIAVQGADVLYTDVWASMGQEEEKQKRQKDFEGFQVTPTLMALAKEDAIFMHCLPAYRGLEVATEVIDGSQSVVFQQAENRLHAQKALLVALLGKYR
ncbi:ornithine carbamoyltransferase [Risungbinella massiliensis]|uniref:ornithine carbamoyltransferase n=1 Tax=Risungbinella massiliensis TaxID=1329796 RepID=UPI003899E500